MVKKLKSGRTFLFTANDNGVADNEVESDVNAHIRIIARALGHHIARQHYLAWEEKQRRAANDNSPATLGEEIEGQGPKG